MSISLGLFLLLHVVVPRAVSLWRESALKVLQAPTFYFAPTIQPPSLFLAALAFTQGLAAACASCYILQSTQLEVHYYYYIVKLPSRHYHHLSFAIIFADEASCYKR